MQIRLYSWAPSSYASSASFSMGRDAARSSTLDASDSLVILDKHLLSVVHAIRAMDGRKSPVSRSGLSMQVRTEGLVVDIGTSVTA